MSVADIILTNMGGMPQSPDPVATPLPAPNPVLMALETRAPLETVAGLIASPLLRGAPKGDGHPVIVVPPFGAADEFTFILRWFLRRQGFEVFPWGAAEVLGLHRLVKVAVARLREVRSQSGQKVSLVGHSLGGIYAREVARFAPELTRSVITLGTPINDVKANSVWPMFEATSGTKIKAIDPDYAAQMPVAPPVPTTSLFSKSDGVVNWRSSLDHTPGQVENIEVVSSHCGLPSNPMTLYLVAHRLAQPEDEWAPFAPKGRERLVFRPPIDLAGKRRS